MGQHAARAINKIIRGTSVKKQKAKNARYRCSTCSHKTTWNQANRNGGKCMNCKEPLRAILANPKIFDAG